MRKKVLFIVTFFALSSCHGKREPSKGEGSNPEFTYVNQSSDNSIINENNDLDALRNSPRLEVETFDADQSNSLFLDVLDEVQNPSTQCSQDQNQPKNIRLLTRESYRQSVLAVFDVDIEERELNDYLPIETDLVGFLHLRESNVLSADKLESYLFSAEYLAEKYEKYLESVLNCGQSSDKCFEQWFVDHGDILWRKALTSGEIESEVALFSEYGSDLAAFQTMVVRILISPYFLYRTHVGGSEGHLTSWEVATILSDHLWRGKMDSSLIQKAKQDGLQNQEAISNEIGRMIQDAKFLDGLQYFSESWLGLSNLKDKNVQINDQFLDQNQLNYLQKESSSYLFHLTSSNQDTIQNIFSSDFTVLPPSLGQLYNFQPTGNSLSQGLSGDVQQLRYGSDRSGLLGQPSVLVSMSGMDHTNIPLRGKKILGNFLCQHLETPEEILDVIAGVKFDKSLPAIDAIKKLTSSGSCADCHVKVNGAASALEGLSPTGLSRVLDDHQQNVSTVGELLTPSGDRIQIRDGKDLGLQIGKTLDSGVCLTVNLFRLVSSRMEREEDVCRVANAYRSAEGDQGQIRLQDLVLELMKQTSLQRLQ